MSSSNSLGSDIKNVGTKSLIYGLGTVLIRAINILVLPLYTHYLTPADYGIVAISTSLTALLSLIMPLSLYSAIVPFYYRFSSNSNRISRLCNIWLGMIIFGLILSIGIQILEQVFSINISQLLFEPYVRLLYGQHFCNFSFIPLNVWQAEEKPRLYVLWTSITLLLTVAQHYYL